MYAEKTLIRQRSFVVADISAHREAVLQSVYHHVLVGRFNEQYIRDPQIVLTVVVAQVERFGAVYGLCNAVDYAFYLISAHRFCQAAYSAVLSETVCARGYSHNGNSRGDAAELAYQQGLVNSRCVEIKKDYVIGIYHAAFEQLTAVSEAVSDYIDAVINVVDKIAEIYNKAMFFITDCDSHYLFILC